MGRRLLESVIIPIDIKSGAQDSVDFITISLVSHASKIALNIFNSQARIICKVLLGKHQFDFRKVTAQEM